MAHTKSARKRIRQDEKRHQRNQSVKSRIRTLTKKFRTSLDENDDTQSAAMASDVTRALGKAASKGIMHSKTASRKISRVAKAANRKLAQASPEKTAAS